MHTYSQAEVHLVCLKNKVVLNTKNNSRQQSRLEKEKQNQQSRIEERMSRLTRLNNYKQNNNNQAKHKPSTFFFFDSTNENKIINLNLNLRSG